MDVVVWLRRLGLGRYEAAFRENEIDERILRSLTAPINSCENERPSARAASRMIGITTPRTWANAAANQRLDRTRQERERRLDTPPLTVAVRSASKLASCSGMPNERINGRRLGCNNHGFIQSRIPCST